MTTTWNGTTLPEPAREGIRITQKPIVSSRRMLNGTLRVRYRTYKAEIAISWVGLSAAERTTLLGAYVARIASSGSLSLPDGQSYTCMSSASSWSESHWYDYADTPYYDVSFTVEEV